ncbi:MAG: hypothetical protein GXP36_02795, partial [Actinobacteria bacterium]|nr:hypothetical protein [Actinomycetota bacterium]
MGRWVDVEGGEVMVVDGLGRAEREPGPVGALMVDGKGVVIVIPTLAPAGGWLVRTTLWCEGYDPST